ncbi:hypothetical protein A2U01_0047634, partial [Trifolium medium]|nr:hypothetical protein [Trifolium medium]
STPAPPPSRTTALIPLVGESRGSSGEPSSQMLRAPGPQESETPHLHPKP